jgi:formylglycine-generating enzyme required for sulfatase activity
MKYSPEENCPMIMVNVFLAAEYCNWLSDQDGIPPEEWCYEMNVQSSPREKIGVGLMMLLKRHPLAAATSSYFLFDWKPHVTALRKNHLSLKGYRLPTGEEWEYATRAGALTSRYFGETEELLSKYAWYVKNSQDRTWPVGGLKPNDWGLFDMHGNVSTWCDAYEDKDYSVRLKTQSGLPVRGGSYGDPAVSARSAFRLSLLLSSRYNYVGLRPARTCR